MIQPRRLNRPFCGWALVCVALASCAAGAAVGSAPQAARALAERVLAGRASGFTFEAIPAGGGQDVFEIESRGGKVVIRGNTGVAMAMGLKWYLKHSCHHHVSWYGDRLSLPDPLPAVEANIAVKSTAPASRRYRGAW